MFANSANIFFAYFLTNIIIFCFKTNMKITNNMNFNNKISYTSKKKTLVINSPIDTNSKDFVENTIFPCISFKGKKEETKLPLDFKLRIAILEKKNVDPYFSAELACLPFKQYIKALQLVQKGIKAECISELTELKDGNYKKALYLADIGVIDFHLHST